MSLFSVSFNVLPAQLKIKQGKTMKHKVNRFNITGR